MEKKKIIPAIFLYEGKPVQYHQNHEQISGYEDAAALAAYYANIGADAILLLDLQSDTDAAHEHNIDCMKEVIRSCEIPVYAGGVFRRFEDAKKYLYTGAAQAVLSVQEDTAVEELEAACARFGKEKLLLCVEQASVLTGPKAGTLEKISEQAVFLQPDKENSQEFAAANLTCIPFLDTTDERELIRYLKHDHVAAITGFWTPSDNADFMALKYACREQGIAVNLLESSISWEKLKKNSDGMVPVIVQDYKTDEVLMLAYMNEEAFQETLACGRMTYFSRSRKELWKKGLTSGHYQFVKSLTADCDYDTILAKVYQAGAACHTGAKSCFFNEMVKKEYRQTNPLKVFEDVFATILDRKQHPKEGSYTNYLFDKGIDKILKKVGEEATEIVIAAKNPNPEEIKYEISDFLYHMMVLMAERGITWEDITTELAQR